MAIFFTTLGRILSTVMSYPIFSLVPNFALVQLSHSPNLLQNIFPSQKIGGGLPHSKSAPGTGVGVQCSVSET